MWQESGVPSSCAGILTTSFCSRLKFPKVPSASRELMSQWWEGTAAIKLLNRKWHGIVNLPTKLMQIIIFWNLPKPLISVIRSSNFMLFIDAQISSVFFQKVWFMCWVFMGYQRLVTGSQMQLVLWSLIKLLWLCIKCVCVCVHIRWSSIVDCL